MVGSITWPSFFEPIKIGVLGDFFGAQFSGGGAKLVFLKKHWVKKGISENKMCTFFLGGFWLHFLVAACWH